MTPEEFQEMYWGKEDKPLKPLPKFERMILVKHGTNITVETPSVIHHRERQLERMEQTRRRARSGPTAKEHKNNFVNKDMSCNAADDIITGIVRSFAQESTHRGQALLKALLRQIIQTMHVITAKDIELTVGLSTRQSQRYNKAIGLILVHLERTNKVCALPDLEELSEDY